MVLARTSGVVRSSSCAFLRCSSAAHAHAFARTCARTRAPWMLHGSVVRVRSRGLFGAAATKPDAVARTTDEVMMQVKGMYTGVLKPLNTRVLGPLEKGGEDMLPMPMVFVLGNHSSGKSTFINFIAGKPIQATGVAPTDDSFTIIAPGNEVADQDGHALIGDPSMGFRGLQLFGTALINHLALKVRPGLHFSNIMVVDSPGMIDAPSAPGHEAAVNRSKDRGYDFAGVVKWFAERADIILLFQDPQKPGTTGETLSILTTALLGQDYKTFIILNKADQFGTVHDFARAYGALCWNLSKVIPRKDLPRIYTMCVPVAELNAERAPNILKDAMADLEATRNEIIGEVQRAPVRRADNLITRLHDSARLLKMHAVVLNAVRKAYTTEMLKQYGMVAAGAIGFGALSTTLIAIGSFEFGVPLAALTLMGTAGSSWYVQKQLVATADDLVEGQGLEAAFRRVHYLQLAEKDEFIVQIWERVRPQLQNALRTLGIRGVSAVRRSDLQALDDIIEVHVPALRRAATKSSTLQTSVISLDAVKALFTGARASPPTELDTAPAPTVVRKA